MRAIEFSGICCFSFQPVIRASSSTPETAEPNKLIKILSFVSHTSLRRPSEPLAFQP